MLNPQNFLSNHPHASVLLIIGACGGFGGIVFGFTRETSLILRLPFAKKVDLGFIGDMLVGLAASFGVFFVAHSLFGGGDTFDLHNLRENLRLISLSLLSGYAGIKILDSASRRLSEEVENEIVKKSSEIEKRLADVIRVQELASRVEFFIRENKFGPAMIGCEEMLKIDPKSELAEILKAKVLAGQGEYKLAIEVSTTLLNRNKNNARARYNQACYRCVAGESKDAVIDDLKKAIALVSHYKGMAAEDKDFITLRGDPDFLKAIS
jgi:hypothetical protein